MLSASLEAAELLELAHWKDDVALEAALAKPDFRRRLGEECADFFLYLLAPRSLLGNRVDAEAQPAAQDLRPSYLARGGLGPAEGEGQHSGRGSAGPVDLHLQE